MYYYLNVYDYHLFMFTCVHAHPDFFWCYVYYMFHYLNLYSQLYLISAIYRVSQKCVTRYAEPNSTYKSKS